jgi:hypothetical protein
MQSSSDGTVKLISTVVLEGVIGRKTIYGLSPAKGKHTNNKNNVNHRQINKMYCHQGNRSMRTITIQIIVPYHVTTLKIVRRFGTQSIGKAALGGSSFSLPVCRKLSPGFLSFKRRVWVSFPLVFYVIVRR